MTYSEKRKNILTDISTNKNVSIPFVVFDTVFIQCVYKISFDDYFYIGSTLNLKDRIFKHIKKLKDGKSANAVLSAYNNCSCIKVDIIELVTQSANLRNAERLHIISSISDEKILNKRINTHHVEGLKRVSKLIIRYNNDGTTTIFNSITEAAKTVGYERNNFIRNIRHAYKIRGGCVFKEIDERGNIIVVTPIKRKSKYYKHKKEFI